MHASQSVKPPNHEETIKHLILPHELKLEHKTRFNNFEGFKGCTQAIYLEWL